MRPDFIIGDRFGTSCAPELANAAIHLLREMGYVVAHNKPYAGGYITEHYGRPLKAVARSADRGESRSLPQRT